MLDFFHHLFTPRMSNNHRAKLLHHSSLILLIIALVLCNIGVSYLERSNSGILGITANFNQDDLLLQTNKQRAENGLAPLQLNPQLSQAAYQKGLDMLAKNYWAHNAPDGTTPWVFIKGAGYEYVYAGENLARGFSSAEEVVTAWMNSQGHKDNILSANYDDVGFAVLTGTLTGDETILVVQEFGRKMAGGPGTSQTVAVASTVGQPSPTGTPSVLPTTLPTTVPPVAQVTISPSPTALPLPPEVPQTETADQSLVASVQQNPLIDSKVFSKNFSLLLVSLFLFALAVDIIIIERKKIARLLSHNIDHMLFLGVILLILLTIGRGVIL